MEKKREFWIDTSGFQYPEWREIFYPKDLSVTKMLAYYSQRFATTEINYTFRRLPSDKTLNNWLAQTPSQFRFTLKALQQITDFRRLKNCSGVVKSFLAVAAKLGSKRGALLFQLPPSFKRDLAVLDDFLAGLPSNAKAAFEFRNESWFTDEVFDLMRRHKTALCIADSEKLTTPAVFTAPFTYFRLRRGNYSQSELRRWAKLIEQPDSPMPVQETYVYFKHEDTPEGALYAEELLRSPTV